jgi:broad specificity phosphatase PhoE
MAVITTLILTRHGEAHCNVAGIVGGDRACTGLTDWGRRQVELLAGRLHAEEPCHVLYTTTRRRAVRQTRAARPHRAGPRRPAPRRCRRPSLERDQNRVRRASVL